MKFSKSVGSPIRIVLTSATSFSFTSGHRFDGTYSREAAEHFCPWYSKEPRTTAVATASASADGCARMKSLPPVSPTRRGYPVYVPFATFAPTVSHMPLKTSVEPVKWMPARLGARDRRAADGGAGAVDKVDDSVGQAGRLEEAHVVVRGERGGRRGLPHDRAAHQRRCRGRFPPMQLKLNGLTAKTKPSSGRYSRRFQTRSASAAAPRTRGA